MDASAPATTTTTGAVPRQLLCVASCPQSSGLQGGQRLCSTGGMLACPGQRRDGSRENLPVSSLHVGLGDRTALHRLQLGTSHRAHLTDMYLWMATAKGRRRAHHVLVLVARVLLQRTISTALLAISMTVALTLSHIQYMVAYREHMTDPPLRLVSAHV